MMKQIVFCVLMLLLGGMLTMLFGRVTAAHIVLGAGAAVFIAAELLLEEKREKARARRERRRRM